MLFNSAIFIEAFLPIVFAGFFLLARFTNRAATMVWLTLASLVFYGWWQPSYVPLLVGSVIVNFLIGRRLTAKPQRVLLFLGIAVNVSLLAYFKYTGFGVEAFNEIFGTQSVIPQIALPLGISFFTFQQIAYLIDSHDGMVVDNNFWQYSLFVTFFPHLISGPITHNREIVTQLRDPEQFKPKWDSVAVGATLFFVGLFKKVMIADTFAKWANPVFDQATTGVGVSFIESWGGALSYAMQLYFDFSAYSEMAIGLGLLFGIALPINFNSPYKARNIIDFWSRWHITLTRFLTAYVYNPIVVGISRSRARRNLPLPKRGKMGPGTFLVIVAVPTLFTMFISGLWHGAGWQFIIFGVLHGFYLIVAHAWRQWKARRDPSANSENPAGIAASVLLTFLCVVVAQVFFRAADVSSALNILSGMIGFNGFTVPLQFKDHAAISALVEGLGWRFDRVSNFDSKEAVWVIGALAAVWTLPNTLEWLRDYRTAVNFTPQPNWLQQRFPAFVWRPSAANGLVLGAIFMVTGLIAISAAPSEFIYFKF